MATIVTRSGKGTPLTNNEVDANFNNLNTDKAELSGAVFTGAITTNSTIDGRDVAADGVTADAALPKAGGAMTGAITTNSTFDGVDIATRDGVLSTTTTTAMPTSNPLNHLECKITLPPLHEQGNHKRSPFTLVFLGLPPPLSLPCPPPLPSPLPFRPLH